MRSVGFTARRTRFFMFFLIILLLIAVFVGFVWWQRRNLAQTNNQRARALLEQRQPVTAVNRQHLPDVMQRYLAHVLVDPTPITAVQATQRGTFELNGQWQPFRATHIVTVNPPGFRWTAGIRAGAGLDAQVVDYYVDQTGGLEAHLLGAFRIMSVHDNTPTNTGELMRYMAEMPWYPTAFLGANLRWHSDPDVNTPDSRVERATATLSDGAVTATITFFVNEANEIDRIEGRRYKGTDADAQLEQWRGRFWDYQLKDGVRVPTQGEVMWVIRGDDNKESQDSEQPYWRGTITDIIFYRDTP